MEKIVGAFVLLFALLQAIFLNTIEFLGLPWFVTETVVIADKSFYLGFNKPHQDEYYIASKYGDPECGEGPVFGRGNVFPKGTEIVVTDIDNVYRFPDFSLKYMTLYYTNINGVSVNIIGDNHKESENHFDNLRRNINESKCST